MHIVQTFKRCRSRQFSTCLYLRNGLDDNKNIYTVGNVLDGLQNVIPPRPPRAVTPYKISGQMYYGEGGVLTILSHFCPKVMCQKIQKIYTLFDENKFSYFDPIFCMCRLYPSFPMVCLWYRSTSGVIMGGFEVLAILNYRPV